jgi:hypothetical protein
MTALRTVPAILPAKSRIADADAPIVETVNEMPRANSDRMPLNTVPRNDSRPARNPTTDVTGLNTDPATDAIRDNVPVTAEDADEILEVTDPNAAPILVVVEMMFDDAAPAPFAALEIWLMAAAAARAAWAVDANTPWAREPKAASVARACCKPWKLKIAPTEGVVVDISSSRSAPRRRGHHAGPLEIDLALHPDREDQLSRRQVECVDAPSVGEFVGKPRQEDQDVVTCR